MHNLSDIKCDAVGKFVWIFILENRISFKLIICNIIFAILYNITKFKDFHAFLENEF